MPGPRTRWSLATSALLAWAGICVPLSGAASDDPAAPQERATMILVQPEDAADEDFDELEQALEAHVLRLGFTVRRERTEAAPQEPRAQEERAREILVATAGRAVVCIDAPRRRVILIHLDSEGRESRLERTIDCLTEDLGRCSDAIASVVSSAVSSWEEPPAEAARPQESEPEYAVDNELSPLELTNPPWDRPEPLVYLSAGPGYGGLLFDGSSPGTHGFDLGLWIRITRYVLVEAALDFYWPIEGRSADIAGWLEVGRTDVAGRVGAALPIGRFLLTLTAGAVFDFAEVEAASEGIEIDGSGETRKGFSLLASSRLRILEWLSVWLGAGLDVLDSDLVYRGTDPADNREVLLRCGAVQARLVAGIEVGVGLGAMPEP